MHYASIRFFVPYELEGVRDLDDANLLAFQGVQCVNAGFRV